MALYQCIYVKLVVVQVIPTHRVLWRSCNGPAQRHASRAAQAIAMHGGSAAVAQQLGWKARSRKPHGYWESLPNVRREFLAFCKEQARRDPPARLVHVCCLPRSVPHAVSAAVS